MKRVMGIVGLSSMFAVAGAEMVRLDMKVNHCNVLESVLRMVAIFGGSVVFMVLISLCIWAIVSGKE